MKEIVRAAGQHGLEQVESPGTAYGVLKMFKERLRYAVRKAQRHSPHIIKFIEPQMKFYDEDDGPCCIPKNTAYRVDIPLRKSNYDVPPMNSGGRSSSSTGDMGGAPGGFNYRALAMALRDVMGPRQHSSQHELNLTFPGRSRRQKALQNAPANVAIEDDSQTSQTTPKDTQKDTPAIAPDIPTIEQGKHADLSPKDEIETPPPAVRVYSPVDAANKVQEAIDKRTAERKRRAEEEEEEEEVKKKPAMMKRPAGKHDGGKDQKTEERTEAGKGKEKGAAATTTAHKGKSDKSKKAPDEAKKRARTETAGKPPPMAENSPTVYYLNGKVQRNGGMFRAYKYSHAVKGVAESKKDKKFHISKLGEAEAWKQALEYIEEGREVD